MTRRDTLIYISSFTMLLLLVGLIGYLTFIPVPADNKELIITVLGVLLGGGAAAMPNLFGDKDGETNKLREQLQLLQTELAAQKAEHDVMRAELRTENETIRNQYDKIVAMLVERHVVHAAGVVVV